VKPGREELLISWIKAAPFMLITVGFTD